MLLRYEEYRTAEITLPLCVEWREFSRALLVGFTIRNTHGQGGGHLCPEREIFGPIDLSWDLMFPLDQY